LPDSLGHLPSGTKADVPTRNLSASRRIACSVGESPNPTNTDSQAKILQNLAADFIWNPLR
jgi:hypothetical protein